MRRRLLLTTFVAALAASAHAQVRLEAGWITREPRLAPPPRLDAPADEGWPAAGDRVQWIAHVINRGPDVVRGVGFTWRIDGETAGTGTFDALPGTTEVPLGWRWTADRHRIEFDLDPPAGDATGADDVVAIDSHALSAGFTIERQLYDWMLADGRPGFERWLQGQVDAWNAILARGVFPTAPEGALDRLRVDRVDVLPDGALAPNASYDTDVFWNFRNRPEMSSFLHVGASPLVVNDQTIVLHELLHGRGLVDLYAYVVRHGDVDRTDSRVEIAENGRPVVGTALMPFVGSSTTHVYVSPLNGLMGSEYRRTANLTEFDADGLNMVAGRRTPLWLDEWGNLINGFSNAVWPGSSTLRYPDVTEIALTDASGHPLAGARVDVYLDHAQHTYQNHFRETPDASFDADGSGVVGIAAGVFDIDVVRVRPPKPTVIVLGVRTATARGFAFVPVYDVNMLWFRDARRGRLTVPVRLQPY